LRAVAGALAGFRARYQTALARAAEENPDYSQYDYVLVNREVEASVETLEIDLKHP